MKNNANSSNSNISLQQKNYKLLIRTTTAWMGDVGWGEQRCSSQNTSKNDWDIYVAKKYEKKEELELGNETSRIFYLNSVSSAVWEQVSSLHM